MRYQSCVLDMQVGGKPVLGLESCHQLLPDKAAQDALLHLQGPATESGHNTGQAVDASLPCRRYRKARGAMGLPDLLAEKRLPSQELSLVAVVVNPPRPVVREKDVQGLPHLDVR